MIRIFHNNRCGKSRAALRLLEESGKAFETVEYLKDIPDTDEIKSLVKKLRIKPQELIRTQEPVYLEKFKDKNLSDDDWIQAMHENPILIERPVVVNGNKAVIARPPEKAKEVL